MDSLFLQRWNPDHIEDEEDEIEAELSTPVPAWTRSSPADLYFSRDRNVSSYFMPQSFDKLDLLKKRVNFDRLPLNGYQRTSNQFSFFVLRLATCHRQKECLN